MSQVASRPPTSQSMVGRLPQIQHPLSRLGNPGAMEISSGSRVGASQGSGRPLACEDQDVYIGRRSSMSAGGRLSRASLMRKSAPEVRVDAIPEGVEVMAGDPSKTRLPIFGSRADVVSRAGVPPSRAGDFQPLSRNGDCPPSRNGDIPRIPSRLSTASGQARLEIDELESIIREKIKTGYYEVKKRFTDNDPEGKGNVSRDALFRILVTVLSRPITTSQFNRLTERLGFKDKQVISFTEFFSQFREPGESTEYPRWMDPIQRQVQDKVTMTAAQVHSHLKEKAKQRVKDIVDLIPQCNPDGSGYILKPEFRNVLNRMNFYMDDDEFDKLWARYDPANVGTINGEKMMQKFGISIHAGSIVNSKNVSPTPPGSSRPLRKKEAERQRSLDIERWLKSKFREGFSSMKVAFEACDAEKSGMVCHADFLEVIGHFGLRLEKAHLADFLARCSVAPTNTHVPYREFLHRFQDRSEMGIPHNILTNPKHPYNRAESPDRKSTMSALETQLMNMFQRDFLALLGTFHKIDKLGLDYVSQEEFRAAIESRFELEMDDDQFAALIDRVPLDEDGNVKYADFMAQFDTRGKARSLFDGQSQYRTAPPYRSIGVLPRDPSPPPRLDFVEEEAQLEEEEAMEVDAAGSPRQLLPQPPQSETPRLAASRRSSHELFVLIKDLLKVHYQDVEQCFQDMDELNTGRLSQEMMYQLLKRFPIEPEITRGEIRDIWKTFITNQDKTLDYMQLVRHFGYSLRSAAYPNAKVVPPRRGDSDFMMRSRKLNCAADMLQDNLRSKIDYLWEDLRREFVAMDPYGTGYVSQDEFRDLMTELVVHLSNYELETLSRKFNLKGDGRVSYVEFLKPFALKRQVWRHGNNMLSLLQHPNPALPLSDVVEPPNKGLTGVTAKLRNKLSGDWKNLRRAFRKLDNKNSGFLGVPEFRSVLKLANVVLDEDEVYHIMTHFDEDLTGKISYNRFLSETFQPSPPSRRGLNTPLRRSAEV